MARAQENQVFAVMANRVHEGSGNITFAGGSAAVDPFGRLIFEAGREESRYGVELDFGQIGAAHKLYDYGRDQRLPVPGECVEHADGRYERLIL